MNKKTISVIALGFLCAVLGFTIWFLLGGDVPILSPRLTHSAIETQGAEGLRIAFTAYAHDIETQVAQLVSENSLTFVPTPSINSQNWLEKWLRDPTCQIPCWENITPGTTKIDEAVKIITQIPNIQIIGVYEWFGWNFDQNTSGSIFYDITTKEVISIDLRIRREKVLFLNEIINTYGQPKNVTIDECVEVCFYSLFYENGLYLVIEAISVDGMRMIKITPETRVVRITFFSLPPPDFIVQFPLGYHKPMIEWKGYGEYDFSND